MKKIFILILLLTALYFVYSRTRKKKAATGNTLEANIDRILADPQLTAQIRSEAAKKGRTFEQQLALTAAGN